MEQSPSWEPKRSSATQEIRRILWNRKFITACTRARPLLRSYQRINLIPRLFWIFRNVLSFLLWGVFSISPNPQSWGPPLGGCPRLLIRYIHSYPPYLQAVPPSAAWGRAMPWWQGPIYCGWFMTIIMGGASSTRVRNKKLLRNFDKEIYTRRENIFKLYLQCVESCWPDSSNLRER